MVIFMQEELDVRFSVEFVHRVRFTTDLFSPENRTLLNLLERSHGSPAKVMVFIDSNVTLSNENLIPQIKDYFQHHADFISLASSFQIVPGGEAIKNESHNLEKLLHSIEKGKLCRRSYVIVIGGGAVLDAVGLSAAIAHRGVRLIRVATTTLSQADSVVGVKNGVNAFGKKNYLGSFAPPWAIINDESLLRSLNIRDWVAGFSEAVKVALLKDGELFEQISSNALKIHARDEEIAIPIIRRSAILHLEHITKNGDPFEVQMARPLDFGHWSAHKLEQLTHHTMRHGEAVAIGVALDVVYSHLMGTLSERDLRKILLCLEDLGFSLYHPVFEQADEILDGLEEFREHLGGILTITLLKGIGQPYDVHQVDHEIMKASLQYLSDRKMLCELSD